MEKGFELLLNEKRKDEEVIPMFVLISDGRANVRLGVNSDGSDGRNIKEEIDSLAEFMYENGVHIHRDRHRSGW